MFILFYSILSSTYLNILSYHSLFRLLASLLLLMVRESKTGRKAGIFICFATLGRIPGFNCFSQILKMIRFNFHLVYSFFLSNSLTIPFICLPAVFSSF
jgi:hypothetical protein